MPLAKVNEVLQHATENHYGVAAMNVFNYETVKWVAEAANREKIPVIIQLYPGFDKLSSTWPISPRILRCSPMCRLQCIWTIPRDMKSP